MLGCNFASGQRPQFVVPAGVWQAARATENQIGYTLVGCTVAPGFDFADFEMPTRAELERLFPQHQTALQQLTYDENS